MVQEFPVYFCNVVAFHQDYKVLSICSQEIILSGLDTQAADEFPTLGSLTSRTWYYFQILELLSSDYILRFQQQEI